MFGMISKEERLEIEDGLYKHIIRDCWADKKEKDKEFLILYAQLQNIQFKTKITESDLRESVRLTIELLEELKQINNNGLNKEKFTDLMQQKIKHNEDISGYLGVWNKAFNNDGMIKLMHDIDRTQRVIGAFAIFMANPIFVQTVVVVYDVIVDNFDDKEKYMACTSFLLRGILRMNAEEK